MRRVFLIAKRDYLVTVTSKTFLFGLIVFPLLFGGSLLGVALMKARPDLKDRHVALIDRTGQLTGPIAAAAERRNRRDIYEKKTGIQISPRYIIDSVPVASGDPKAQLLALSNQVRRQQIFAVIDIAPNALTTVAEPSGSPKPQKEEKKAPISCYTNAGATDLFAGWLGAVVNDGIHVARLSGAGIDDARAPALLSAVPMDTLDLLVRDAKTGEIVEPAKRNEITAFVVPFGTMMLLAMIVMIGSLPMLGAITEDKSQRVVEMLLGVATPFELMMGKVLAGVARALTSSILYVGTATVTLIAMQVAGVAPLSLIPWFYVYLLAEVSLLCALAAALGAACNTPQEAQNLAMVVLSPIVVPMFLVMPVLSKPDSGFATAVSLFPPFTPLVMIFRQAMPGGVPAWQPWVGLIGVVACSAFGIWAASRIFRTAILSQGQPFRIANLIRWTLRG